MGLLTAAVAGNSQGIFAQQLMPLDFIQKQFDVLNDDFKIKAVKTGMLANKDIINVVAKNLEHYQMQNIVLDPVIITKHGATLLADDAYQAFLKKLVPFATIITPNFFEAQKLTGLELKNESEIKQGAKMLQKMGAKNVLIKGSHHNDKQTAVIAAELAKGNDVKTAVKIAKDFTYEALSHPINVGAKYGPINHLAAQEEMKQ